MSSFSQLIVATAMACLLSCVVGTTNNPSAVGTSTTACQFGWYYNFDGKICLPCPPGTTGSYGFLGASPPLTSTTDPLATSLIYGGTCIACPGGSYGNGTIITPPLHTTNFPLTTYFSESNVGKCALCPAGTFSSPLPNPASTANGGWLFSVGAAACAKCPPGYVSSAGASECVLCPAGFKYQVELCDGNPCKTSNNNAGGNFPNGCGCHVNGGFSDIVYSPPTCVSCGNTCPSPSPTPTPKTSTTKASPKM